MGDFSLTDVKREVLQRGVPRVEKAGTDVISRSTGNAIGTPLTLIYVTARYKEYG